MPTKILKEKSNGHPGPKRITVFTPSYNRAALIETLYQSLRRQAFHDFEWIVVDDGSSDSTEALFDLWLQDDNPFSICYIKQENGGKHRAVNQGLAKAQGELFFIVDSDDYLPDDALTLIDSTEKTIPADVRPGFAGICGCKAFFNGKMIGSTFENREFLDITYLEREQFGIRGDRAEVFYTGLLKRYPFPEFEGENFITECVVWDRIGGDGYKFRYFNRTLCLCEYRQDGLSSNIQNAFIRNPRGYALYLVQSRKYRRFTENDFAESCFVYFSELRQTLSCRTMARYLEVSYWKIVRIMVRFHCLRALYHLYMSMPAPVHNLYRAVREKIGAGFRPVK